MILKLYLGKAGEAHVVTLFNRQAVIDMRQRVVVALQPVVVVLQPVNKMHGATLYTYQPVIMNATRCRI